MFKIYSRYDREKIIFESKTARNIREVVLEAVKSKADLQDANLQDADLRGADLQDADLQDANLRGADLRGAEGLVKLIGIEAGNFYWKRFDVGLKNNNFRFFAFS